MLLYPDNHSQDAGQAPSQSAFATSCRSVNRNDHIELSLARDAPRSFMAVANPGKLVSIVAQPLTVIGAFAFMPSVKNDIAIR